MTKVYVLHHVHGDPDDDGDVKLIGVYSTHKLAKAAVARLGIQPGFSETPEGFQIDEYVLDRDYWAEGYVTVP